PSPYQIRRGVRSLRQLDAVSRQRCLCTAEYARALLGATHVEMPTVDTSLPLYYFPVLVKDKSGLLNAARRRGIELIAWPRSTPIYPIDDETRLAAYGYAPGKCPVAESVSTRL